MSAKIMVVDDEVLVAESMRVMLQELGYAVSGVAASEAEALAAIERDRPDVVLMDINLFDDHEGVAAAETIRARHGIPVVYVTAYADNVTLSRAKVTHPFGYVIKPFEGRDLQVAIEIALHNHQLEQRLAESELKFRTVVEEAGDGFELLDAQGRYVDVNTTTCRQLGYTREELLRLDLAAIDPLMSREMFTATIESLENRPCVTFESVHRRKDGTTFPVEITASVAQFRGGKHALALVRDITQRKAVEQTHAFLAHCGCTTPGEDFFQSLAHYLAQSLGADFVCIDRLEQANLAARTVAVYCDGKFQDNVIYTLQDTPCGEVVGKKVCCFPSGVCQLFPKDAVLQEMGADGYLGVTLWNHAGQPIGLIALIWRQPLANPEAAKTTLEIVAIRAAGEMERVRIENTLRESEDLLNETGHMAKVGGWAIDLETDTLTWTEEVYRIHEVEAGFKPTVEQAIGFYVPEVRPVIQQAVERASLQGESFNLELELVTARGRRIWVQAIGGAKRQNGRTMRIHGTFQDITGRKQAELMLQQKVDELERFNALTVDREFRMIELKKEVNALLKQGGQPAKYPVVS